LQFPRWSNLYFTKHEYQPKVGGQFIDGVFEQAAISDRAASVSGLLGVSVGSNDVWVFFDRGKLHHRATSREATTGVVEGDRCQPGEKSRLTTKPGNICKGTLAVC
jgi:hypothetical protein